MGQAAALSGSIRPEYVYVNGLESGPENGVRRHRHYQEAVRAVGRLFQLGEQALIATNFRLAQGAHHESQYSASLQALFQRIAKCVGHAKALVPLDESESTDEGTCWIRQRVQQRLRAPMWAHGRSNPLKIADKTATSLIAGNGRAGVHGVSQQSHLGRMLGKSALHRFTSAACENGRTVQKRQDAL